MRQKEGVIIERRYKQGSRGGLLLLGMGLCNPNLIRNNNSKHLSVINNKNQSINDKQHLPNNNPHSLIINIPHLLTPIITL